MVNVKVSKTEVVNELRSRGDDVSDELVSVLEGSNGYEEHSLEELVNEVLDVHEGSDVDYESFLEEEDNVEKVAESLVKLGKMVSLRNVIKNS